MIRGSVARTRLARPGVVGALLGLVVVLAPLGAVHAAPSADPAGDTPPGAGWIRTGQFVAGLAPVEIQLTPQSGSAMELGEQVSYGSVSTYRKVAPGNYTVSVRPESAPSSSAPMLRRTLSVSAGTASTVALLGTRSAPRLATLSDDLTSPAAGSSRVRVLSGSSTASGLTIKAVDGPQIASGVVLGQTTSYATVPDGDWTLQLDRKGAKPLRQAVTLDSGAVYTAVVLDSRGEAGVRLSLVTDAQGAATMPRGGAATGDGGTATDGGPGWLLGAGVVGVTMIGLGAVGVRRAPRRLMAAQ